jgi:hypothetical protein
VELFSNCLLITTWPETGCSLSRPFLFPDGLSATAKDSLDFDGGNHGRPVSDDRLDATRLYLAVNPCPVPPNFVGKFRESECDPAI